MNIELKTCKKQVPLGMSSWLAKVKKFQIVK